MRKYVINAKRLRSMVQLYHAYNVDLYYPTKVNFNELLLGELNPLVNGYEVDSIPQVKLLIDSFKVSPERILFCYPLKTEAEIIQAMEMGVSRFVVDNYAEAKFVLEQSSPLEASILIRLSIDNLITSSSNYFFKWGASVDTAKKILAEFSGSSRIEGFSFYLPQEVNTLENFQRVLGTIGASFEPKQIRTLDIGGGIPPDALEYLLPIIYRTFSETINVIVEPGRHFVGPCIDMIVDVIAVRDYNGRKAIFLDTGIYNGLIDVVIKDKHFDISSTAQDCNAYSCCEYIVCGKSSDVSDIIGHYRLPANLKKGDLLRINGCGAYCSEMETSFYNNHTAGYEVL